MEIAAYIGTGLGAVVGLALLLNVIVYLCNALRVGTDDADGLGGSDFSGLVGFVTCILILVATIPYIMWSVNYFFTH